MGHDTVAVTLRSFDTGGPAMEKLRRHLSVGYVNRSGKRLTGEELARVLPGVAGVIAGTEPFTAPVLEAARDLRVIARVGVGLDSVDLEAASRLGITVTTTPLAPVQAVAEHTLALLLAVARRIPEFQERVRAGEDAPLPGVLLSGKTAGIVGMGRIGTRVGEILEAIGCGIAYYDPVADAGRTSWKKMESLGELARASDILSLHAPAQPGNRPLIGGEIISRCRRGVLLVNTARGSLIDEAALARGLEEGIIGGAGLDVFAREPYQGPLLGFSRVVATPHVASNTTETRQQMEMEAVDSLIDALAGRNR